MAQVEAIVDALKATLKAHKFKYRDVAPALGLSEASVKRLFRTRAFDLQQLDSICQLMEMEISDLVQTMTEQQVTIQELTREQEEEIASDPVMLMITVCVLNRWTFTEITEFYKISEAECIQKLARLDRLRIIELLPKNRIKLLVSPNFNWRKQGPIESFFHKTIKDELFSARFDRPDNKLTVLNGMLSEHSNHEFQRKLDKLAREFDLLNNTDAGLDIGKRHGTTVVLAMRDWHYRAFESLRRDN